MSTSANAPGNSSSPNADKQVLFVPYAPLTTAISARIASAATASIAARSTSTSSASPLTVRECQILVSNIVSHLDRIYQSDLQQIHALQQLPAFPHTSANVILQQ